MTKCRDCLGVDTYRLKTVEIAVNSGTTTALVTVEALECEQCGSQLLDTANADKMFAVQHRIEVGDTERMEPVGTVYRARQVDSTARDIDIIG